MDELKFLKDEECVRCGGSILAESYKQTRFIEETFDYVSSTVWICYDCGYGNKFDSQPYYEM